jgi:tRNA C32,U32 (ribose-2'-O)-methylase TrmJ
MASERSMSDDPDFSKANHALQVLRRARLSRNDAAAIMVADLVYETSGTDLRSPEIEEARQDAWDAISELAKTLRDEGFAGPALWKAALRATESWIELLD